MCLYFCCRVRWGRVGTDVGKNKLTDYGSSKDGAKAEFREVFLEKTGNEWEDRKNFVKKSENNAHELG